jgi:phosphoribosyl 1,2-cyclic phosphate phosphodiesterase
VKLTFLGTGTSYGVPQVGCDCAVCRSSDPRDRRTRTGALVETNGGTRLLIDTPPELRLQLVAAGCRSIDALLITHDHADHTHGLDDIRGLTVRRTSALPILGPAEALASLERKFPYVFDQCLRPLPGTSKPEGQARVISPGELVRIGDAEIEAVEVPHGPVRVFGYRIGAVAYVTDAKSVPAAALARLRGVSVLVINALWRTQHPTHLSIDEAVEVARSVGARRTLLTHLTHEISHETLAAELPEGIEPAYDGLVVSVD